MKVESSLNVKETQVDDPLAKDVFIRVLIGPQDGADKFHMRRFRVLPGGWTPHHKHDWEHEIYILAGTGELVTDEGNQPFAAGSVIFVPGNDMHQFKNTGSSELEFLCLIPAVDI